jgi:pilus assembly protein CpaE
MKTRPSALILSQDARAIQALSDQLAGQAQVAAVCGDPPAAFRASKRLAPGLIFVDLSPAGSLGTDLVARLAKTLPEAALIGFAGHKDPERILQGFRAGLSDFVTIPSPNGDLRAVLERTAGRKTAAQGAGADILTCFSLKGGEGVSSLAANLADQWQALTDEATLLLDLNLFLGHALPLFGAPPAYTIFDLLVAAERIDEQLLSASLPRHERGFQVLTTPDAISDADSVTAQQIADLIRRLRPFFTAIVIDLPHDLGARNLAALEAADKILLVARQTPLSVRAAQRALAFFDELDYPRGKVNLVINHHSRQNDLKREDMEEILRQPVAAAITEDNAAYTKATERTTTSAAVAPGSQAVKDLADLAGDLSGLASAGGQATWTARLLARIRGHSGPSTEAAS